MKNDEKIESTSLRKTLSLAASVIFHSSALLILAAMPISTPLQKAGDMVTVDIQDKSAQSSAAAANPITNDVPTAPVSMPAAPATVAVTQPVPQPLAKPVIKAAAVPKPIKVKIAAAPNSTPSSASKKMQTDLPAKINDSQSDMKVAVNEVESSPETAQDVDADAAALMASAKEEAAKEEIAQHEIAKESAKPMAVVEPVAAPQPPAQKAPPVAAEQVVMKPAAPPAQALGPVSAAPAQAEATIADKTVMGAGDGAVASHGSPEGVPAGVVSEAQLGLPVYSVKPYYPTMDKVRGFQGQTDLVYTVGANGTVSNIKVLKSSGSQAMDQSAVKALSYFRYHAQPKDVEVMKRFAYRLNGTAQEMPARLHQAGATQSAPSQKSE